MDILRTKKRGFFSISHGEFTNSFGKKKVKGSPVPLSTPHEVKLGSERDDLDSSDISTNSSTGPDTGSSCDEINKASKKQKTFAKKTLQRDRKKEKEKLERKEKNKLSMDDFLLKQIEFHMWLDEEKNKQSKEMSSPKKKAYFKSFIKLWNKKKLPAKYYRGSAETESPCPSQTAKTFTFNFTEDDDTDMIVRFKRPKPKRLSIEPCGLLDSPFSTFGKTPPKQLAKTSLQQLDEVMSLQSFLNEGNEIKTYQTPPTLGDYQEPLNSLLTKTKTPDAVKMKTSFPLESPSCSALENNSVPNLVDTCCKNVVQNPSPIYAVPWKPKTQKTVEVHDVASSPCKSPPPPPVPPKPDALTMSIYNARNRIVTDKDSIINTLKHSESDQGRLHLNSVMCNEKCATGGVESKVNNCSIMLNISSNNEQCHVDNESEAIQNENNGDGWKAPVLAKPFSPPLPRTTAFVSPDIVYEEISFFQERVHEADSAQANLTSITEGKDNEGTLVGHNAANFSFSKYLISDQYSQTNGVIPTGNYTDATLIERGGNSYQQSFTDLQNEDPFLRNDRKRKPVKNDKFTNKVSHCNLNGNDVGICDGVNMLNQKCSLQNEIHIADPNKNISHQMRKNQPLLGSKSPRRNIPELGKQAWQLRTPEKPKLISYEEYPEHVSKSENRIPKRKPIDPAISRKIKEHKTMDEDYLETDIDSTIPVPVMGSKTPPRQRKPLMSLQRSKSMETIIW